MRDIKILLVEDNEGDILLTMEAFRQASITNHIEVVRDGEQAIQYLEKTGEYAGSSKPDLIFLDINLPKVDGKEVLQYLKTTKQLARIPVMMLTTSDAEEDINECYNKGANCYITKPADLRIFFDFVQRIKDFWIMTAQLPNTNLNE